VNASILQGIHIDVEGRGCCEGCGGEKTEMVQATYREGASRKHEGRGGYNMFVMNVMEIAQ
jgi:hypothetical protein